MRKLLKRYGSVVPTELVQDIRLFNEVDKITPDGIIASEKTNLAQSNEALRNFVGEVICEIKSQRAVGQIFDEEEVSIVYVVGEHFALGVHAILKGIPPEKFEEYAVTTSIDRVSILEADKFLNFESFRKN